ncbi:MAG: amidohydrolase family protein [Rhodospirillales bacterium]|jgi:5-methylthioadenosine/S-adenosylhomocysteine deaminase|nr:amidohydrolase family protein [Rhodospirillales bacterium]
MLDILIKNATIITMDKDRRVLTNADIGVKDGRISSVGGESDGPVEAKETIDAGGMVAMPGMFDGHAHAGHGLVKSMGAGDTKAWFGACEQIYTSGSTEAFWRAEARLTLLERLKCGVTTGAMLLGGGASIMRTDDPAYGDAHCEATVETGIRTFLAVGPNPLPFPKRYVQYDGGKARETEVSFGQQMETCETLIDRWNGKNDKRTNICLILPVYGRDGDETGNWSDVEDVAREIADLRQRKGVLFTQDGHRSGSIAIARDLGLLGPHAFLSHSVDLTEDDMRAARETDTRIVHNPSAIMSVLGRCPAPELIDQGVTVILGSDASAPDRGYDMFRHMAQCMHYHRRHFRDPAYMPPGKVMEMATIDSAKALGLDDELGSLETGKRADVVLVDMRKPHLYPANMPVTRLAHFANGADVDTVIVEGRVLMKSRKVLCVDEDEILDEAQRETEAALERTGLGHLIIEPDDYWGTTRRNFG